MLQVSEITQFEEEQTMSGGANAEQKSSHVRITQPSTDLNKYIVDKFHPPTARSK